MPIQPTGAPGIEGTIDVNPAFAAGLKDLEGFSHIILLYHFHCSCGPLLEVTPFLDTRTRGIFSTRAPRRPNPIGISIVRLTSIEGARLFIMDVDILDGTPLLDIKPYVPEFDHREVEKIGWLAESAPDAAHAKADDRFK
jgi:tRNA-Thr(GGU) m(6)t(6)A37 methyltransferase TsaA